MLLPPSPILVTQTQPMTTETETDLHVVLSMDTVGQLDVFRHYGYMLRMYSTQVGIPQEASQVVLCSLLQCLECMHYEVQIMLHISCVISQSRCVKGYL